MTTIPTNSATIDWIKKHLEVCPTRSDLTWYVALDLVYQDYYNEMREQRTAALIKADFVPEAVRILGPRCRLGARKYLKRSYDVRTRSWGDMPTPAWVLDGVRYYRDKIGGELRFGV